MGLSLGRAISSVGTGLSGEIIGGGVIVAGGCGEGASEATTKIAVAVGRFSDGRKLQPAISNDANAKTMIARAGLTISLPRLARQNAAPARYDH